MALWQHGAKDSLTGGRLKEKMIKIIKCSYKSCLSYQSYSVTVLGSSKRRNPLYEATQRTKYCWFNSSLREDLNSFAKLGERWKQPHWKTYFLHNLCTEFSMLSPRLHSLESFFYFNINGRNSPLRRISLLRISRSDNCGFTARSNTSSPNVG